MLNPFKRKEKITKLYQDLPPGDRIQKLFEERIAPFLGKHAFRFVKSKSLFKRKVGEFTQEIIISKDKWNRADEVCSFWLVFNVIANTYEDWHKRKYGTPPLNSCVTGFYHNHLKKWKTEFELDKYNLSKQDNNKVFAEIKENLQDLILPLFDKFSGYERSADTLMTNKEYWWAAKIYDYYLIAGKVDKARQALIFGKEYYDKQIEPQEEFFEAFAMRLNQQ